MPRQVDLRVEALLQKLAPDMTKAHLAQLLGVSDGTLRSYLENRWTVLDRNVLERLAEFFQCDVSSLLETSESTFFDCFAQSEPDQGIPPCYSLCRADHPETDHLALEHVQEMLETWTAGRSIEIPAVTSEEFEKRLSGNCIVVGSPRVSASSERALCKSFGIEPFGHSQRANPPFMFRAEATPNTPTSSLMEPPVEEKRGIWLPGEDKLIPADSWPQKDFKSLAISRGRDCAVVVVLNHEISAKNKRKLIVLAGFGAAGTEAAAKALGEHFRDLEPEAIGIPVWGVIEVFFDKAANKTKRLDVTYNWRYRVGGRCPVPFVRR